MAAKRRNKNPIEEGQKYLIVYLTLRRGRRKLAVIDQWRIPSIYGHGEGNN